MSTVKVNVIMHLSVSYKLSCIDKFMYMRACLASSINIYMHACFARNCPEALSHCGHGHTLTSVAQLSLQVFSIKHWRQSTFAETPSMMRHSREARQRRASMLVYKIYIGCTFFITVHTYRVSIATCTGWYM